MGDGDGVRGFRPFLFVSEEVCFWIEREGRKERSMDCMCG